MREGKKKMKTFTGRLPYVKDLEQQLEHTKKENLALKQEVLDLQKYKTWAPPGHFYSPIADLDGIKKRKKEIFRTPQSYEEIEGVDFNTEYQQQLLRELAKHSKGLNFKPQADSKHRYYFENPAFSYGDGTFLYSMLRHSQPNQIIEVGSGFSSALTLDVNELFLNNGTKITFIEPYPELLLSLMKKEDQVKHTIINSDLQQVPKDIFQELNSKDILFIDSTHVSKVGSDVNYLFFEILPKLKPGVIIHFHDIFYPFEYLQEWIEEGRAWNEIYLLRAFLQYNPCFKIVLWPNFIYKLESDFIDKTWPHYAKNPGGSIWLEKVQ